MIYELNETEFKNVLQLNTYYNLEIPAILSGYNHGRVFADSKTDPHTAIIWTDDGSFLIGDYANNAFMKHLRPFVKSVIAPLIAQLNSDTWYICSVSNEWDSAIEATFHDTALTKNLQHVYRIKNLDRVPPFALPNDLTLKVQTASMDLFNKPYLNKDYFIDGVLDFWPSLEAFCHKGFGFFVTTSDRILSRCTLDFKYNNVTTLGVATDQVNRRRGYARLATLAALHYCIENGYDPYWDCMATNTGSIGLATGLGFTKDYSYSVYALSLDSL